jgi:hydrogenase nickel incorporation protein HypA/HybF
MTAMHELRIAESIAKITRQEMARRDISSLKAIGLRIGVLSGVDPEALRFSFTAIAQGTDLGSAELRIEAVPVQGHCRACHHDFELNEFNLICPHCGGTDIHLQSGEELDIVFLETG